MRARWSLKGATVTGRSNRLAPAAPEAPAGDCATRQERGNNKADAGRFQWALQAATSGSLRGAEHQGRVSYQGGDPTWHCRARGPSQEGGPQPERGYNKADGGGVPSCPYGTATAASGLRDPLRQKAGGGGQRAPPGWLKPALAHYKQVKALSRPSRGFVRPGASPQQGGASRFSSPSRMPPQDTSQ
jgi:hypothetical protein